MTDIARDELPAVILDYIDRSTGAERPQSIELFAPEAVVTDEGKTHDGAVAIGRWLTETTNRFDYTLTFLRARREAVDRYIVTHRMEGNFPGNVIDLAFVFELRDGQITRLTFE